jgi:hypothetical protein
MVNVDREGRPDKFGIISSAYFLKKGIQIFKTNIKNK